jgi:molybdopterin-biosynthesis enzyme MoeA-like protein
VLTRAEQASAGATSDDASAEAQRDAGELPAAHHRKLMAAFGAAGYSRKASERDRRLALIREVIGSDLIQSSKELTPNEADAVIRYLRSQTPADDQQGLDV